MQPGKDHFPGVEHTGRDRVAPPLVLIIVPMLNERDSLKPLFSAIRTAICGVPAEWEVVAVDDGSTDGTREVLAEPTSKIPKVEGSAAGQQF